MTKHPAYIPSPYATIRVAYGSEQAHLYSLDDWGGVTFHKDEKSAREHAHKEIGENPKAMVAIMAVDELFAAKIDIQSVAVGAR
jgi:hypothetical protein